MDIELHPQGTESFVYLATVIWYGKNLGSYYQFNKMGFLFFIIVSGI
jgi:hypothetical protein